MESPTAEREKLQFNVTPQPFNSCQEFKLMTSDDLCIEINRMMTKVFMDYRGSLIYNDQIKHAARLSLYFKIMPNEIYRDRNRIMAFAPIEQSGSIVQRVMNANRVQIDNRGERMVISDDGQDIFENMILNPDNRKIELSSCYRITRRNNETSIELFNLDIRKFLEKLYGSHEKVTIDDNGNVRTEGSKLLYRVNIAYPMNSIGIYKQPDNWVLGIERLLASNVDDTAKAFGINTAPTNGINIITTGVNSY